MSPPHSVPWSPAEPSADVPSQEGPFKAYHQLSPSETTILPQPWTNDEQEALYIAVERYNLFGRWEEVRNKMQLDRTASEIEQEYMQLYGELPESEDDDDEDEDWSGQGKRAESTRSHMRGHVTPSLTSTSPSSLSARSSQETFRVHYGRPSFQKTHASLHALDTFHDDENDDSRMDIEPHVAAPRRPTGKTTNSRPRSESTAASAPAPAEGKPTRTIRVWTQQQSEQLKNLIEDCFPGGYRINWVWVASKMGNTFTRKQCKNKWEIMRRRAGTEEEINLLKLGHAEFGPSWSQIQEKYLPERSQGGISIMWSLLQAREAEQQQGNTRLDMGNSSRSTSSSPLHSRKEASRMMANSKQEVGDVPGSKKSKERSYQPQTNQRPIGDEQEGMQQQLSDREMMDRPYSDQSREMSMSPVWNREGTNTGSSPSGPYRERASSKRHSVSSTESFTMRQDPQPHHHHHHHHPYQQHHPYRHEAPRDSVPTEPTSESWTERNRPMTWTEPLTRRLEGIILKHFPNHQKVNWVKVSSLMGTTPVVTKDQCKRRWYLMSQNNNNQQQ
ncbi:hypothetical protein BGZ51_007040 [Haplosporangium sp. Z 767]|nr:hypothetical protein BGZ51_007040 [Haplosporangium sp. Z 767]KAF9180979.1 hypothetical protein BGZ50_005781 [Haplosporangium sp. Z 11]